MKRFVKKALLLGIMFVFMIPINSKAYTTFKGHKMSSGIGNYGKSTKFYWVDSSANTYSTKIATAFERWTYSTKYTGITTPISYRKTTNKSASTVDIYKVKSIGIGIVGQTMFLVNQTYVNPSIQNWYWSKIELSESLLSKFPQYQQVTISHEIGHAFGLNHTAKELMDPGADLAYSIGIQFPRKDEFNGINYLYK
ncbi:reprolysin-like metallopeptidase [Gottfriedia acidiceleris]|uniref:reprolysin-like metallopeptidase n=1 Tax=Gottfriedia acidiceleris TaxID=371036 RepID=UPI002FFD6EA8